MRKLYFTIFIGCLVLTACQNNKPVEAGETLFTMLPAAQTGVKFNNKLEYNADFNVYTYRNFYNGGGVAIGDINNDGLPDLYFTGNMKTNALYLNEGDFKFKDITELADVGGTKAWATGVSLADVNGDGWLDIYVCNSGDVEGDNKQNELFINNGNLTFTERAEEYGIADKGLSTHAAFFDYDKDGDLDLYLLNNSFRATTSFNLQQNERDVRDEVGGDKLLRNDDGKFVDVSIEAGIYGSVIGFGLGVTVGDIDKDGWLDIYVSNDFFERDYIYMNNGDGTFTEDLTNQMNSISAASMGADMADINNDGYADFFVTEMLPEPDDRYKTKMTFENWDKYQFNLKHGYYHQFTRNMLQLNNGNGTFSEIGRLAKVEATDWSWGALFADYDNDGQKDIFVANGIYKDIIDNDYLEYISNDEIKRSIITKEGVDFKQLIDIIPSTPISNYMFVQNGNLKFENKAGEWGLQTPSFSNGSAYGDLDNDGDLDLVVNNLDMKAFVYRNETNVLKPNNTYLKVELKGDAKNTFAVGTKLTIKNGDEIYYLEQVPIRGFESTIDARPNFGLGTAKKVEELKVEWYNGKVTILKDVPTNQILKLDVADAKDPMPSEVGLPKKLFTKVTEEINYKHKENPFVDFDRDQLIYHMLSAEGPKVAKGDVNGDGREDLYIGGAKDSEGKLFVQKANGQFEVSKQAAFEKDKLSEDSDCLFFDADGDKDLDLYVASGGNEYPSSSTALNDRFYLNDGRGNFTKTEQVLPSSRFESSSTVKASDFDGDGDLDLFVGVRLVPFYYGVPPNAYLLENDGKGKFRNITPEVAPELKSVGMITDAQWVDYDGDKDEDLILVGEWMPLTIFENNNGKFTKVTDKAGLANTNGWWNCIKGGDFDGDGDMDFVLGNHGMNSRFRASVEKPVAMHVNDYDKNGTVEQIVTTYNGDSAYPLALRQKIVMQMPHLKKKFLRYDAYAGQTINGVFSPKEMERTITSTASNLASSLLINNGDGTFSVKALPIEAQLAPVYGLSVHDFDKDGNLDIVLGGNFYRAKPVVGRYDASFGLFLKGDGKAGFEAVKAMDSGLKIDGEVRDMVLLSDNRVLVARNNDRVLLFYF